MGLFFRRKKVVEETSEDFDRQANKLAYVLVFSKYAEHMSTDQQLALARHMARLIYDNDGNLVSKRELRNFLEGYDPHKRLWRKAINKYGD